MGSVGPIVGRRVVERHRTTWDLAENTVVLQGVDEMEAGSEHCKEPDDEIFFYILGKISSLGLMAISIRVLRCGAARPRPAWEMLKL
jgi:hypothetical protein